MKTLTIISHTEHYKRTDGTLVGLGSTVTEINHLLEIFDFITHVAMFHNTDAPANSLAYASDRVHFIALPVLGGPTFMDKLDILKVAPKILGIINKSLSQSDYFQFRAPTGIGVYVIPYLVFFSRSKGWFKYAGNWKQEHAPLAYRFQKWLLLRQSHKVTINGSWRHQPSHCLSFENPCLTLEEFKEGRSLSVNKSLHTDGIQLCFVGRLEAAKGIGLFIDAVNALGEKEKMFIKTIHIVGDGKHKDRYLHAASESEIPFKFHGLLERPKVHEIYKRSHAIILPSLSEGFPKVITEAMNYGCLPIVSNISSISQYVSDEHNGFLLDSIDLEGLLNALQRFFNLSNDDYQRMINFKADNLQKFTYSYYNNRIRTEILENSNPRLLKKTI